ncbi:hypothetical protein [Streptomyces composti]|uniref:hypothetical protein n=1 Tax=Streptomyces composti TaxID=2720025 RepID=UPI001F0D2A72|nr:hypothetical protein [Streptomyces composti]
MVTKPELGSEGWGEVLNAALDELQAAVDAKLPLTGGTLSDALAVQGPLAVTGTLTADDALTVSGAVATFAGLTSTRASANDTALATRVSGDSVDRLQVQADGDLFFSSGSASADTSLRRASTAQLRITPTANAAASSSVGGALNVTNTSSTGAGIVVYSEQAAPSGHLIVSRVNSATFNQAAIYAEYTGTSHAVSINHQGTGSASSALNVASNNTAHSALGVSGQETGRGTIKVTHTGTGTDANASALSIDLAGTGTAAQGIFLTSTSGGTTGPLLHLRNGGTGALVEVAANGHLKFGSGTGATDAEMYRSGAGAIETPGFFAMGSGQSGGQFSIFGNQPNALRLGTGNAGIAISEGGTAPRMGVATLTAGTVTVNNTSVTANTRIFLTCQTPGGTPGFLRVSARTAGAGFTITSSSGTDTSTVGWLLLEPA